MKRQRGWVGMVLILVALLVVAALAQMVLKRSALTGSGAGTAASTRQPGAAGATEGVDATRADSPVPPLNAPIEQARGVEDAVLKGAAEQDKRIDEQTR